jgi:hypothetical protein
VIDRIRKRAVSTTAGIWNSRGKKDMVLVASLDGIDDQLQDDLAGAG